MENYLSGLNESQLRYLVFRVKEVANSTNESILREADKLLCEFQELAGENKTNDFNAWDYDEEKENDEFSEEYVLRDIQDFENKLVDMENCIAQNVKISEWKFQRLPDQAERLWKFWSKGVRENHTNDIKRLKTEAKRIAKLGEMTSYLRVVEQMMNLPLNTVSSVHKVIQQLENCVAYFEKNGSLTDEIEAKIEKGKNRAVWHRAKKKLAEAEIAEAGCRSSRAIKLKNEAAILLSQDWEVAFPGTMAPNMEN